MHLSTPTPIRRGFTLTELMISIAISLVLILGIAKVFQMTGDTIGTGTALATQTRDQRAALTVFNKDFAGLASTNPGLVIWSAETPAYVDRAAMEADAAFPAGKTPFRTDRLGMFVSGDFKRQTGDEGFLTSGVTAEHAYVWYGHLMLPNNSGQFFYGGGAPITPGSIDPGVTDSPEAAATNPNNFFASKWTLGRSVILLKKKGAATGTGAPAGSLITDSTAPDTDTNQNYYDDDGSASTSLAPLTYNRLPIYGTATDPAAKNGIQTSRFDLGATSEDPFVQFAARLLANSSGASAWWNQLDYLFQCDPFPARPLNAAGTARTSPLFLPGCSEFIVEFAGDYDGAPGIDTVPVDPDGTSGPLPASPQIRWYGLDRLDLNDDGDSNDPGEVTWPYAVGGTSPAKAAGVFAWDASAPLTWPKLIRIIYTTRDANGRLQNPQPIETIFKVN